MPSYVSDEKMLAREWMARWYLERTKGPLPPDLQYWTLCSRQSRDPRSELMQLSGLGLCSREQFVGVDLDPALAVGVHQGRVRPPVVRSALQAEARTPIPAGDAVGPGTDRLPAEPLRVAVDHLARQGVGELSQLVAEHRVALVQFDDQKVRSGGLEAVHVG